MCLKQFENMFVMLLVKCRDWMLFYNHLPGTDRRKKRTRIQMLILYFLNATHKNIEMKMQWGTFSKFIMLVTNKYPHTVR